MTRDPKQTHAFDQAAAGMRDYGRALGGFYAELAETHGPEVALKLTRTYLRAWVSRPADPTPEDR